MSIDSNQLETRRGILLTTNLLFSTMVSQTAAALGREVAVAADMAEVVELCRARPSACIIIDLGMSEIEVGPAMARIHEAAGEVPAIAFGSHVDKARLDEARTAGCKEVLPRSKFSAELPDLLRRYLDGN